MDFRLTNDKGYMVEFIRPEPTPMHRPMPGAEPLEDGDIRPAPIMGLQFLGNAPVIDVIVLDERGFPAPMRCPDPRHWAVHKLWLSTRDDRDPQKKLRDREQGEITLKLISDRLPQFPLDESFRQTLPRKLSDQIGLKATSNDQTPSWQKTYA